MSLILSTVGSILLSLLSAITNFITLIMAQPYLLIGVSLMLIGAGVSFLKRLIRV